MSGKGLEAGKAFWQGVLSKITDPGQRTAAEQLMANAEVMTVIGSGVAGQSEIDRQLQDLRAKTDELDARKTEIDQRETSLQTWYEGLTDWRAANEAALTEAKQLKAAGGSHGAPKPGEKVVPPAGGLTEEQYNERMANERASFLGFSRDQNEITREHFTKFGEIVALEPLLRHPQIAALGLTGVYELVHKDRLDKHKTDAAAASEKAIRDDERQKTLAAQASMPYPSPTGAGSGSPLDALAPAGKQPVVDAAVAEYNRLQAERAGAARPN
jgi:hypothetical protein